MERTDREIILEVLKTNAQLKRLYQQHVDIEKKLERLRNRIFMTPAEEIHTKHLKKVKLLGVDRMMEMISQHRVM